MIPTPTPFPTPDVQMTIMPLTDGLDQELFFQAHQWWQLGTDFGVTQFAQILILVMIIFAGVFVIIRAFNESD